MLPQLEIISWNEFHKKGTTVKKIKSIQFKLREVPKLQIRKSIIFVLVFLLIAGFGAVQAGAAQSSTPSTVYENSAAGIRIEYPQNWELQEGVMGTLASFLSPVEDSSDIMRENANIVVQDLSKQPMTLDQYTELSITQLKQLITDFHEETSEKTTWAENPAYLLVFSGKQGQYDLKWKMIWTIKNNVAYVVTFTAQAEKYDAFLAQADQIFGSFTILR